MVHNFLFHGNCNHHKCLQNLHQGLMKNLASQYLNIWNTMTVIISILGHGIDGSLLSCKGGNWQSLSVILFNLKCFMTLASNCFLSFLLNFKWTKKFMWITFHFFCCVCSTDILNIMSHSVLSKFKTHLPFCPFTVSHKTTTKQKSTKRSWIT